MDAEQQLLLNSDRCTHRALLRLFCALLACVCESQASPICAPPSRCPRRKGAHMKIQIRYDNQMTTIDVPEEDFSLLIQADYDERRAASDDPSIKPRSPQEIVEECFNRPEYNSWHRHWRHMDDNATPRRLDHKVGFLGNHPDDAGDHGGQSHFDIDAFPDVYEQYAADQRDNYQEQCAMLRHSLKPDYAEMIIAIHLDGLSINEYAARIGEKPNTISHRLRRAEKKLMDILEKRPI